MVKLPQSPLAGKRMDRKRLPVAQGQARPTRGEQS